MQGLRILITNITLATRTGTETYVKDLATALLNCGHKPMVYSTEPGPIAQELRSKTVPVVDNLDKVATPPDIIHGRHHPEVMTTLLHFPGVPAIFLCHDWTSWYDSPPRFPRILCYVAVDHTCRDRLVLEEGIPDEQVRVIHNFVDLKRFRPRPPLPQRPQRALIFSNAASEHTYLGAVREACSRLHIHLDVVGAGVGNLSSCPEEVLPNYDIVFAKGRSALEALAVGSAVVLCDAAGVGPMVTTGEMERLRKLNFGIRALQNPVDPGTLTSEISRYNARDAMEVSTWVRNTAGIDRAVDELLVLYQEVIEEHKQNGARDLAAELRAAATYLRRWVPNLTAQHHMRIQYEQFKQENDKLRAECDKLRTDLMNILSSSTIRLRNRIVALPILGPLAKSLAKLVAGRAS